MEFMGFGRPADTTAPVWTSDGGFQMSLEDVELRDDTKTTPFERRFNPYDYNGGCKY